MDVFDGLDSIFQIFLFLIPYTIIIRFIMVTLFYGVAYRGYMMIRQDAPQKKPSQQQEAP
jgi:hypothetical protein